MKNTKILNHLGLTERTKTQSRYFGIIQEVGPVVGLQVLIHCRTHKNIQPEVKIMEMEGEIGSNKITKDLGDRFHSA